jgi:hypothetical protein
MRKPRSRVRKVVVSDELVELFRKAVPAKQAIWRDVCRDRRLLSDEQHLEALNAVHAFDRAAGRMPWEFSALHPRGAWATASRSLCQASRRRGCGVAQVLETVLPRGG